jgi:glycosyltransferase involved in cell wall biosynthesis
VRKNIAQIPVDLNRNDYLFVLPFSEIGGTELQALNLANEFKNSGYKIEICLLSAPGPLIRILESKNISYQHFEINNTSFFRKVMNIFRFSLYLSQGKFLYIYSFLPHAIIYTQICGILNRNAKYISGIRGKLQKKSLITERILGVILRKSEFVIFNSKSIHDEISEKFHLDVKKTVVIHNGVAESVFRKKNRTEKSTKQAIVIANFHSYKNYEQLIDMIQEVNYPCKYLFCVVFLSIINL